MQNVQRFPRHLFVRRFLPSLLIALSLSACTSQRAAVPAGPDYPWFRFIWHRVQLEGRTFEKAAMLVPVQLHDLRGNFVTQFDLGSDGTSLYENTLRNYFATRAQLYAAVDTTHRLVSDAGQLSHPTTGLPLRFGATTIAHPVLTRGEGELVPPDSLRSASPKVIGTIGADFLKGKVLVIDYPHQRMCVLDSVDAYWRARTTLVASRKRKGRLHIPLTIAHRTYWALFDTGASLFPLSTDEQTWKTLVATGPPTDTMRIPSWGEQMVFYGAPMQADVYLGATKLPKGQAWFNRHKRLLDFNAGEQIAALTGNVFFSNSIIVLDYQRNRFGVVKR
jgi:hypothetical protein